MRYLLILLLTWLPMLASAVDFDESTRSLPLGRTMQVLEDSSGRATIDQVTAPEAQARFHLNTDDVLNAGYSKSAFWIRLDLRYAPRQSEIARNWLLELAYPPMDHVELYQADADGHFYRSQITGDTLPYSNRVIRQNNFVFDIPFVPQQAQTLYLRVQSEGSVQVPLTLWSSNAYLEAQPERLYVLGMIYGVLLGMLVYNLFIYVSVRDTSYLYYILYIASFGLYQVSVNGAGVEFLWPENPWWANAATPLLIGAAAFFGCQFSRSFLQTREHSRLFDWLLKGLMVYGLVVIVMSLGASYGLALRLATLLALLFTVVIFSAGVKAWWRGQRQARYFMIAWTAFLAGGVVNTLMVLGYLPNIFITMYSSQLGSALEVGLLSLALADRINAMREEQSRILVEAGHKLELLNQQLSNSNRFKDEFLATVTHELRTPMNGVIGSLELMQTVPMNIELEQYQQTAATSARDMMRMVDDILILTELQAGKLYPRHEPFRLQGLLDGVHLQFARQAHNKGLAFALDILSLLPDKLVGDSRKLALCLSCLLDNAVKFTRQGVVRLQVLGEVDDENNLALTFKIIDTGIGFSYLDEDTLYQRFYQVDSSMTREYGGLGIGLAICRQLAELIGGQLHHQSEPGQGSCFTLSVKLAVVEPLPTHTTVTRKLPEGARRSAHDCTLLLIDDNSVNQLVLRGMLLKLGYRVRTADCATTAIEQMQSEKFDAVLLDCHSPMTDGATICARLREVPRAKDIPVLGIVATLERSDRDRYMAAGMTECMHRPVRFEELQSLLHSWLLAHKQSEQVGG